MITLNDPKILPRLKKALDILLSQERYSDEYLMATLSYRNEHLAHYPEYSGDVPGRWILAMTAIEKVLGLQPRLHEVVEQAIRFQRPEGFFGRASQSLETTNRAQIYGNAWMLQGLVSYFRLSGKTEILDSARRLGDYYLKTESCWINDYEINKLVTYGHAYGCYTHVLEAMTMLYEATREHKYLALCQRIATVAENFEKAVHSHMHLSTLRGMLALYMVNGDKQLLEKVIDENRKVIEHEMLETGGVYECYGIHYIDEACSVCDFFLINLRLWKITGKKEYRVIAEKIFWNHLLFSQFSEGSFGSLPVNPEFLDKTASPAYWCCTMYGANILAAFAEESISINGNIITVNLLFGGEFTVQINGIPVTVSINVNYADETEINIKLFASRPCTAILRIYLPTNTKAVEQEADKDYFELSLDNATRKEAVLKIRCQLRYEAARIIPSPDGKFRMLHDASFYWGPYMLCQYAPMLKKRGHFIIIAEKADSTFEFINAKQHKILRPDFAVTMAPKVNYMRLTGDDIEKNLNSANDIFETCMCPVGDFTGKQCKVSYDVIAIQFEQAERMIKIQDNQL